MGGSVYGVTLSVLERELLIAIRAVFGIHYSNVTAKAAFSVTPGLK